MPGIIAFIGKYASTVGWTAVIGLNIYIGVTGAIKSTDRKSVV